MAEKDRIRAFISQYVWRQVSDDEDVFASGLVDSLFALQLVLFVESEFSIKIGREDLHLKNFRTIDALAQLVQRKMGKIGAAES